MAEDSTRRELSVPERGGPSTDLTRTDDNDDVLHGFTITLIDSRSFIAR